MSDSENDDEETDFYANMITCEDCEGNEFIPDDDELADDETELTNEEKKIRAYKTTCSATCICNRGSAHASSARGDRG